MIFTFGYGQHCGCGRSLAECFTELPSQERMEELWGRTWSRAYDSEAAAGVDEYGLRRVVTDADNAACRCAGTARDAGPPP